MMSQVQGETFLPPELMSRLKFDSGADSVQNDRLLLCVLVRNHN